MRVSVCVPATRAATVGATVSAIRAQTWKDWELLVLGQGDETSLMAAIRRAAGDDPRVAYLHLEGRGLSRARNHAMSLATGDVLAFTDDDCEPNAFWLEHVVAGFLAHPDVGLIAGPVIAPAMPRGWRPATCPVINPSEALYDPVATEGVPPPGWDWMGANFAIRAGVAARIGRWDECLGAGTGFPAGEDTDYKFRLEAAGVPMLTLPAASVLHAGGVRVGIGSVLRSQRNYALGNGALAGKQTLAGDERGAVWLRETRDECLRRPLSDARPDRMPATIRRLWYFEAAYRRCLRCYEVDVDGLLRRRRPRTAAFFPA